MLSHSGYTTNMVHQAGILLCSDSSTQRKNWQELLTGGSLLLWDELSAVEHLDDIEILLVGPDWSVTNAPVGLSSGIETGHVGVIALGVTGLGVTGQPDNDTPADVRLPVETSSRELQLVCRLLGEIIRLRRGQQQSDQARSAMENLAMTDHLTGTANRRAWDSAVDGWSGGLIAVIDLDNFKEVNDQFGHSAGDQTLKLVAERLQSNIRSGDVVARLGGDEFGLLLSESAVPSSGQIVDRIRSSVAHVVRDSFQLTASAGFAVIRPGCDVRLRLVDADSALQSAKSLGRDRTVESDSEGTEGTKTTPRS